MKLKEHEIAAAQCKDSYRHFFFEFWDTIVAEKLIWNWHLDIICDELQAMCERIFKGLPKTHDEIINVCPGSSKSMAASIMLLPWCWTRMPHLRFIGASYAYPLALDLSRKSRDVIKSEKYQLYFPGIQLRADQDTKGYFANTKGGMRYAVGTRGSVTGMHGHLIIIDDPIDPNQSVSETEMEAANRWIGQTLLSRKVDRRITATALIMQRLSQGDPTDEMRKRRNIRHLIIPATDAFEVQPESFRQFYKDGLMDLVRLPEEVLKDTEAELGPYGFAGQFGQSPVPLDGSVFMVDRIDKSLVPPQRFKRKVRFWDRAGKKNGDWTAGVKMGIDLLGRYWVIDVKRFRMDSFSREKLIKETAAADGFGCVVAFEKAPGEAGDTQMNETIRAFPGYRLRFLPSTVKKEIRAELFGQQVNGHNVTLIHGKWNDVFIEELKYFPLSNYDDQVDAASGAFNCLLKNKKRIGAMKFKQTYGGRRIYRK